MDTKRHEFTEDNVLHRDLVFPIYFKERQVGEYIPDLIADDAVIIDAKVIDRITDHERGQMIHYLRITGLRVGLLIDFKRAKLERERIIL